MKLDNPSTEPTPLSDTPTPRLATTEPPKIGMSALLSAEHRSLLERSPDEPFDTPLEYLRSIEADIQIVALARDTRDHVHEAILQGDTSAASNGALASIRELADLRARLKTLTAQRLDASTQAGRRPLLATLTDRLHLTSNEATAFAYMVVTRWTCASRKGDDRPVACAAYASLSSSEMSAFLAPERLHIQQGLVEVRRASLPLPDLDSFAIPDAVIRMLAGETVNAADCLFLQETVLAPEATRLLPASSDSLAPYADDMEYLTEHFEWVNRMIELRELQVSARRSNEPPSEGKIRGLAGQVRELRRRCEARMAATRKTGGPLPRLEKLADDRRLTAEERLIVLVLAAITTRSDPKADYRFTTSTEVWTLITLLTEEFPKAISLRRLFYRTSTLRREGFIRVEDSFGRDFISSSVTLDRRILDYIVDPKGTESEEFADGSKISMPKVSLDQVILPAEIKSLVADTAINYEAFRAARARFGLNDLITYGHGLTMLFHGPSGTGKTMLAMAVANAMGKHILVADFPRLGPQPEEIVNLLFREARLRKALLFFDECDGLFETRENQNPWVAPLLTELERHDDLVIFATNRPLVLDDAMQRRITLSIEFTVPDESVRREIWRKHLPDAILETGEFDLARLARVPLTGGLIKNAVIAGLSAAVNRQPDQPAISQVDLERAAKCQVRSRRASAGLGKTQ